MQNWISVTEDMPQKDPNYETLSVEVEVMLQDGTITEAFCEESGIWYYSEDISKIPKNNGVVKWRSKQSQWRCKDESRKHSKILYQ